MRLLKLSLISIAIFAVLLILFSLLFPSKVRISRAINIAQPMEKINREIRYLNHWRFWNQMIMNDESPNKVYADSFFFPTNEYKSGISFSRPGSYQMDIPPE